ncbi:NFX1-type zinc finger-containing 1-like, partial [Brachionus plicatilis]
MFECDLTEGVVRIGGRSKSPNLEPYILSNIKKNLSMNNKSNRFVKYLIAVESNILDGLRRRIDYENESTNTILNHGAILRFNVVKETITESQTQQLIDFSDREIFRNDLDEDFCLLEWLGFFQEYQNTTCEQTEATDNQEEEDIFDSDNESMANERILESDLKLNTIKKNLITSNEFILNLNNIQQMVEAFHLRKGAEKKIDQADIQNFIKTKTEESLKFSDNDFLILQNFPNIWKLDYTQRFLLYSKWQSTFLNKKQELMLELINKFNQSASILAELRLNEDKEIMEHALIVAMTTTGSTKYHNILKDIGPKIFIVEEAAEVFEAHIVGSLSKHCEHLILIGDHIQLRPNPAVYNLARIYKLDVSLFERLINNNFKRVMLNSQHRMRPDISKLMKYFYEQPIQDDPSVHSFPQVLGLTKNIFFINHKNWENATGKIRNSKINDYEISYVVKLVNYLTNSGHEQEIITVLSMYLGQTMAIKKELEKKSLISVKISTVDNYQGEENKIIILSLVRSNRENKIGFVNVPNRVCVALSRAKHGLYVLGNFDFFCLNETNNKWKLIVQEIKQSGKLGELDLTCHIHTQNNTKVSDLCIFDKRINCNCDSKCGILLKCGHCCTKKCHASDDLLHEKHKCMSFCGKTLKCSHKCRQICSKHVKCDKCYVTVNKIIEPCGHEIKSVICDSTFTSKDCKSVCNKKMSCGHLCTQICNEHTSCSSCPSIVDKIIPDCGHEIKSVRCESLPTRKD